MVIQNEEAVVRSFFDAFARGDIPTLLNLLTDDVKWKVQGAPYVPWTGQRQGRAQVEQFFAALSSADTQQFQIQRFVVQEDQVIVLGYFKWLVKETQRAYDGDWAIHFVVHGNKIVSYQMFENSYSVAEAFRHL